MVKITDNPQTDKHLINQLSFNSIRQHTIRANKRRIVEHRAIRELDANGLIAWAEA